MREKKFIILLTAIFLSIGLVHSESWDDYNDLDKAWDGQKAVTNKEFDDVIEALEANQKKKEEKQRKKKIKKISGGGTSLHSGLNPDDDISEVQSVKSGQEGILINCPVCLLLGEALLEKGFYMVYASKRDNKIYIQFYQSQFLKGEIEAFETNDDFGEEQLNFARLISYNSSFMKLIFGSIDFNAYAYIPYIEE